MNEHDLFLESHRELTALVRWIGHPIVLVERSANVNIEQLIQSEGSIVYTDKNSGVEVLRGGFSHEAASKIIDTFLDSHRKLQ